MSLKFTRVSSITWTSTQNLIRGRRGCDRMVVGFTCAISTYHHQICEFETRSWLGVLDTTLCDKVVSDL